MSVLVSVLVLLVSVFFFFDIQHFRCFASPSTISTGFWQFAISEGLSSIRITNHDDDDNENGEDNDDDDVKLM